jgi:hypothetical protein
MKRAGSGGLSRLQESTALYKLARTPFFESINFSKISKKKYHSIFRSKISINKITHLSSEKIARGKD